MKITTKQAVEQLVKALKEDEGYWISWQANIAMAFYDACDPDSNERTAIHEVANKAATNFLDNLCYISAPSTDQGEA